MDSESSQSWLRRVSAKVAEVARDSASALGGISKAATYLNLNPFTPINMAKEILKNRFDFYKRTRPFDNPNRDKIYKRAQEILDSKRVKLMALYKTPKDLADYAEREAFREYRPFGGKKKGKSRKSSKTRKNRKTRSRK
jgi:hypothetical protein